MRTMPGSPTGWSFAASTFATLVLAACTSSPRPADASTDANVDPDVHANAEASVATGVGRLRVVASRGGRLRSEDGLYELYVPAGAIAQDTEFSVTKLEGAAIPADIAAAQPASGVYSVEPDGLRFLGAGAYERFVIPTVPDGVISNESPPAYHALAAVTRAASGGVIENEPESETVFEASSRGATVFARVAHLSLKIATASDSVFVATDLAYRRIDIGPRTRYPTRVGYRRASEWFVGDPNVQSVFVSVGVASPLVAERFGTTESSGALNEFGVGARILSAWDVQLDALHSGLAMPPPTVYCDAPGAGNSLSIGTRRTYRAGNGEMFTAGVSLSGVVDCIPGAPPWDAGVFDVPVVGDDTGTFVDAGLDATDVRTDTSADTRECALPAEVRCGSACVNLGSNPDHCGRCGNICLLPPGTSTRTCEMGRCRFGCAPTRGDCDGDPTNGCEVVLTRPGNCGGCGLSPPEICNGVDDDCDLIVDEGCPRTVTVPGGGAIDGRLIGMGTGPSRTVAECAYPGVATGIYGEESGGRLNTVGFLCGSVSLLPERSVTPYRYNIVVDGYRPYGSVGAPRVMPDAFSFLCPPNTLVTQLELTADTRVNSIRATCSSFFVLQQPDGTWAVSEMRGAMSSRVFGMPTGSMFDEDPPPGSTPRSFGGIFSGVAGTTNTEVPSWLGSIQFRHKYLTLELH